MIDTFDRAAHLRTRTTELEALSAREDALYTLLWRNRNLVTRSDPPRMAMIDRATVEPLRALAVDEVFLGLFGERPLFGMALPGEDEATRHGLPGDFNDLRMVGAFVPEPEARLLAYARGLLHWHLHHRHCAQCGAASKVSEGGHVRVCEKCEARHFPRTDPAIMALIIRGEQCLLARQPKWPPSMFSILAGFVEPGESIEEAVVREVREEVGLEVHGARYVRSQPWPFPASLMLGFAMRSDAGDIRLGDDELEDARWVSREDILARKDIMVPPTFSLAGQLIELFVRGELALD